MDLLAQFLLSKKWKLTTAESCTGGGLAFFLTELPGASQWFDRGFVTYSNESKHELLNVPLATIKKFGAVSEETARAMAIGALANSQAQVAVAITGIAGPTGGTQAKPVGTVWFAIATPDQLVTKCFLFPGNRQEIRQAAIEAVQVLLLNNTKEC